MLKKTAVIIVLLGLCGCIGLFTTKALAARGHWTGPLTHVTFQSDDGQTVAVPVIIIESGPAMTSPSQPGSQLKPDGAVLVDQDDRIVEISPSLTGQKIRVGGLMLGRPFFDRRGHRLVSTSDARNLEVLQVKGPVTQLEAEGIR